MTTTRARHTAASRRRHRFPTRRSKDTDVILRDSFTDTNGVAIADHTPDRNSPGNSWVVAAGTYEIQSNKLEFRSPSTWSYVSIDLELSNVDISGIINVGKTTGAIIMGAMFRFQDTSNFWSFKHDANSQKILLEEKVSGSTTVRGESAYTIDDDTNYTFRVLVLNDYIKCVATDGTTLTYTSSSLQANTKLGFVAVHTGTITNYGHFEDYKVKRGHTE